MEHITIKIHGKEIEMRCAACGDWSVQNLYKIDARIAAEDWKRRHKKCANKRK